MEVKKLSQRMEVSEDGKKSVGRARGPDGPHSWFIAALCFVVSLLYSSIYRCSGLFYASIMAAYGVTRAEASLPFAIYGGFSHLSSLPAGPLIQGCGLRISTFIGGLLISIGCLISAFATGTTYLAISIGVLAGSGHGVLLSCVIVIISRYFEKKRGIALGFNLAGSATASFFFTNIFEFCLAYYGLGITIALAGALALNIPVISLLFLDPPWTEKKKPAMPNRNTRDVLRRSERKLPPVRLTAYRRSPHRNSLSDATASPEMHRGVQTAVDQSSLMHIARNKATGKASPNGAVPGTNVSYELPINTEYSAHHTKPSATRKCMKVEEQARTEILLSAICLCRDQSSVDTLSGEPGSQELVLLPRNRSHLEATHETSVQKTSAATGTTNALPENTDNAGGTGNERQQSDMISPCSAAESCWQKLPKKVSPGDLCEVSSHTTAQSQHSSSSSSIRDSCKEVLSLPRFYVHAIGYFSYCFFLDTLLCVVVDCATDRGISDATAAQIITLFSVTDIAGRVLVPLFTDNALLKRFETMTLSYLIIAIIATSLPLVHINLAYAALLVFLGFPMGYIMVAMPQTMAVDIGLKNLPIAFGFAAGLTATGGLMTPLLLGYFRDEIGSYDGVFYFMGGLLFASFSLLSCLWIASKSFCKSPFSSRNTQ